MVFVIMAGIIWLWAKGYDVEQALLKIQSLVVSIHIEPAMIPIPGGTFRQGDVEGVANPGATLFVRWRSTRFY
jgi:hypothetical protein